MSDDELTALANDAEYRAMCAELQERAQSFNPYTDEIRIRTFRSSWDPRYRQAVANFTWKVVQSPQRPQRAPRGHRPRPARRVTATASAHGPPDRPSDDLDDPPREGEVGALLALLLELDPEGPVAEPIRRTLTALIAQRTRECGCPA